MKITELLEAIDQRGGVAGKNRKQFSKKAADAKNSVERLATEMSALSESNSKEDEDSDK